MKFPLVIIGLVIYASEEAKSIIPQKLALLRS